MIDSFAQHAAASFGLSSVVCWVGTHPNILGYKGHVNLIPDKSSSYDTYHSSYLDDFDLMGNPVQFPYDNLKIFDSMSIIKELE